jgi:hypothetical protein
MSVLLQMGTPRWTAYVVPDSAWLRDPTPPNAFLKRLNSLTLTVQPTELSTCKVNTTDFAVSHQLSSTLVATAAVIISATHGLSMDLQPGALHHLTASDTYRVVLGGSTDLRDCFTAKAATNYTI